MTIATDPRKTGIANAASVLYSSAVAVAAPADLVENALATITVPAGAIGPNGQIRIRALISYTNNANSKTLRIRLGGIAGTVLATEAGVTTQLSSEFIGAIANRNAANSQIGRVDAFRGTGAATVYPIVTSAVDTAVSTTIVITGEKTVATDAITLESVLVEVIHA